MILGARADGSSGTGFLAQAHGQTRFLDPGDEILSVYTMIRTQIEFFKAYLSALRAHIPEPLGRPGGVFIQGLPCSA
jgi:hypothetical protein